MSKQQLHIVKIGGNIINNSELLSSFLKDFSELKGLKILVHGGGKKATELANSIGLEPKMVNGRRITDEANLEIVTMVYAGLLNKNIVAELQQNNCNALGLSGTDANCILAHKRIVKDIDYGFAGDIDAVNTNAINVFLQNEIIPVFCAISHDKKGQLLNTNADTIASELAIGLSNLYDVSLVYTFEKNGVLLTIEDEDSVIEDIDSKKYETLKSDNIIADGMLPKMENCFHALSKGVSKVIIGNPTVISNQNQKFTTLTL
ncbi:acetylglutamate kinase [Urechidicola croceus]|uniref:Acetylglutamate kinase n=1 Tax=Urechidicola croceus TaxID=1850246 RepID=A0A1D8P7C4_9FLAO|nr:acetylglutamate kinase [Urechidicola croceus]AOW20438.1 acetylglutamate kinase [Urechidicola croceus]